MCIRNKKVGKSQDFSGLPEDFLSKGKKPQTGVYRVSRLRAIRTIPGDNGHSYACCSPWYILTTDQYRGKELISKALTLPIIPAHNLWAGALYAP